MSSYFIPNLRGNSTFTQSTQEMEGRKVPRLVRWLAGNALDTEPGDLIPALGPTLWRELTPESWPLASTHKLKQNKTTRRSLIIEFL